MRIQQVKDNKIQYLDLLQFADPNEEALEKNWIQWICFC